MEASPLRIRFVEDVVAEAELAAAELRRSGLLFAMQRVETSEQLVAALAHERQVQEAPRESEEGRRFVRESVAFGFEPCAGMLPVLADSGHLDQVMVNLVANAADAMPPGRALPAATGSGAGESPW